MPSIERCEKCFKGKGAPHFLQVAKQKIRLCSDCLMEYYVLRDEAIEELIKKWLPKSVK